ncbi:hypothetical protein C2G38_2177937 [Gigaspora rosea]|uniref:Uncharacterized protein n=1 Tax=Gigaspora rosea TaxID=44941 RepID=A0A397VG47_9GLOM|nr:hypothetical protein C2G38_2177937 [Gigaspora rosea]
MVKYDEAFKDLTRLLEIKSDNTIVLRYRDEINYIMKRYNKSITDLEELLRMSTSQVQSEKTPQCIFANLIKKYSIAIGLKDCDFWKLLWVQKWLEELSNYKELLPKGLLFLVFDNKQKEQKNYLNRESNIIVYHIVTSFVAFNMALQNRIQYTNLVYA